LTRILRSPTEPCAACRGRGNAYSELFDPYTYWLLLTALQWSSPGLVSTAVPGMVVGSADDLIVHLLAFAVLGLLVLACRPHVRMYLLALGLGVYAVRAETMGVSVKVRTLGSGGLWSW